MKTILLPALVLMLFLASCSSTNYPTEPNPYPYPNGRSYPQQGVYPNEPVIVDRQGRVITRDGRVVNNSRNLPPGQAKKIYGGQSARAYAPGQQKKINKGYDYNQGKIYQDNKQHNKGKKGKGKGKK